MANILRDPVCGMEVSLQSAASTSEYKGNTYYFCSQGCKESFDSEPEKFLARKTPAHAHPH